MKEKHNSAVNKLSTKSETSDFSLEFLSGHYKDSLLFILFVTITRKLNLKENEILKLILYYYVSPSNRSGSGNAAGPFLNIRSCLT